jgi:hypothetical protein
VDRYEQTRSRKQINHYEEDEDHRDTWPRQIKAEEELNFDNRR